MYLKNVSGQKIEVFAFDYSLGSPKTGDAANITCYVNIDDAGYNALTDTSATESDSTNRKGLYVFDLTQGETNGTKLAFFAKSSTANVSVVCRPAVSFTQPATGILAPTTAGRTLDVSSGGEAGVDWANVGSPTTSLALTGTTIATTQKVDVETIKTQSVTCAAGVTVNVNVGTTQPVNFTGTSSSALVKTDMVDIAGAAVSTSTAQLGVNVVNFGGSAGTFSSGRPEVNTTHIAGTAWASTTLFTLASHDPGATIGTSTLTQAQVTGGAYNVQSSSCVLGDPRIANLDATVSSRLATSGYTTPPTAAQNATAALTTQMTESYATDGTAPTLAQAAFFIQQLLSDFSISGTTITVRKLDGSTTAFTLTLNDATTPTGVTR